MVAEPNDIEAIYNAALAKGSQAERSAYLDAVCGDDAVLRARVEALLKAHAEAGDFLEEPAIGPSVTLGDPHLTEGPGTVIGRYKLLEQIGEGGFGVVYMADQTKPISRRVALKIIKLGMDTKSVIARFEAERQALAMMDHPNIAKVLDAGATETGRPYFVMELVTGVSITEYCDKNELNMRERLALFIQVCNAVQHAHQKGIIHRDIKPSNVMVTHRDGTPVPKIIDFGIAKAINQRLTEKTLFTRHAHIIGTPAYMSPEQAELSDLDIDTRSDIYSLGVLLYELLTGTPPFSEEELRKAGYIEMQRIIREEEPTKPSTMLSLLGETLPDVAKHRASTPDLLRKAIRGDLDWIVMKSLEKDRGRRYETANGLAMDIQRHLNSEPVLARGPSAAYRLQKFLRRHQTQAVGAAAAVVLLAVMAAILAMYVRASNRAKEAEFLKHKDIMLKAMEFRSKGQLQDALSEIKGIVRSEHVGPEARLLHAQLVLDLQGPTAAVQELEVLLGQPEIPEEIAGGAHFLAAEIYYDGDPDAPGQTQEYRAKWEYHNDQAELLLPPSADTYLLQARRAGTVHKTLKLLDQALELDRGHYDSIRELAYLSYASRDFVEMVAHAGRMVGIRPDHGLGYSLCAVAQRELKQYEAAMGDHDQAIELAPDEAEFYDQRRQTYLQMERYEDALEDARTCVDLDPNEIIYRINLFCDLTALGRYDDARIEYDGIVAYGTHVWHIDTFTPKYVFDSLHSARAWHPDQNPPEGPQFWPMIEAADHYRQWAAKAQRAITKGFHGNWSPDGNQLVYSCGVRGSSGIAIWNRVTGKTRLLTIPGRDPTWSPNGQTITYVRNRKVLPVHGIPAAQKSDDRDRDQDEIWLVKADGTQDPKFLTRGNCPQWSRHSNRIFFRPPGNVGKLYSISPDGEDVKRLMLCPGQSTVVSPDDRYLAYSQRNSVQVREIASGKLVAQWLAPPWVWDIGLNWSPDVQALSISVATDMGPARGLWIFELKHKTISKVLSGSCRFSSWSPSETGEIAIEKCYGNWFYEIWAATTDTLGPGQSIAEVMEEAIPLWAELIESEPEFEQNYRSLAAMYLYMNDAESAFAYLDQYERLVKDTLKTAGAHSWLGWRLIHAPQDTIEPEIAIKLYDKVLELYPNHHWNLGQMGIACYRAGKWQDAIDYLSRGIEINGEGAMYYYAFFLAMAQWQAGDRDKAQIWYENVVAWMKERYLGPNTANVACCFYMEAAELMGLKTEFFDDEALAADRHQLFQRGGDTQAMAKINENKHRNAIAGFIFGEPVNLGSIVNSKGGEWDPCISADGLELYFHSDQLGGPSDGGVAVGVSTRQTTDSERWSTPVNAGLYSAGTPSISADGRTLFFSSNRPGGSGNLDLWMTTRETPKDDWGTPKNLGSNVNSSSDENAPCISSDGLELYFTSNRDDWKTWVTKRATKNDPWGTAVSLGPIIHSGGAVMHASISADGLMLFFTSWRPGGCGKADIWVTRRATKDSPWTEPVNLGAPVNSSRMDFAPCLSPDGSILYFTSNRRGGFGNSDLWQVPILSMQSDLEQDSDPESTVKSNKGKN